VRLLVRTWNVFHGNALPPERHAFLADAVQLVSADGPDIVLLQELPVWSLRHLCARSGMTDVGDAARRPMLGPFPSTAEIGRVLTDLHHGLFRSAFTGQANAILLGEGLKLLDHRHLVLNPWSFRRRLDVGFAAQAAWAKERRGCQVVRLARDGSTFIVANLHATSNHDKRLADAELLRAATFVDGFANPGEPVVFGGDFNVTVRNSRTLPELTGSEWDFEGATPTGIDHILVRGLRAQAPARWPLERRRVGGRVLSDHAPVEREIA
jgi:endonuclease/exonuclease/phosphatase family metal-dependent hydrolase